MRVAYLINQYPAISHTFIRREIQALEEQGVAVERFAHKAAYGVGLLGQQTHAVTVVGVDNDGLAAVRLEHR